MRYSSNYSTARASEHHTECSLILLRISLWWATQWGRHFWNYKGPNAKLCSWHEPYWKAKPGRTKTIMVHHWLGWHNQEPSVLWKVHGSQWCHNTQLSCSEHRTDLQLESIAHTVTHLTYTFMHSCMHHTRSDCDEPLQDISTFNR